MAWYQNLSALVRPFPKQRLAGLAWGGQASPKGVRGQLAPLGAAWLGTLNDSYFRQAALILAVAMGHTGLQGAGFFLFTLPFMLLAAPAGWVADRFEKRSAIIVTKCLELVAVGVGSWALCTDRWWLLIAMLGLMGAQMTFALPVTNAALPDLYRTEEVPRAIANLRGGISLASVGGYILSGLTLGLKGTGWLGIHWYALALGVGVLLVALAGLVVSCGVSRWPAANPLAPFPWTGPWITLRHLWALRKDPLLAIAVAAYGLIGFSLLLETQLVNPLALRQLGLSMSATSALKMVQMLGMFAGGQLCGRWNQRHRWSNGVAVGVAMGVAMLAVAGLPRLPLAAQGPVIFLLLGLVGLFCGALLVPIESFKQTRPEPTHRGALLAAGNFLWAGGILGSVAIASYLNVHAIPTASFGIAGWLTVGLSLGIGVLLVVQGQRRPCHPLGNRAP